MEDIEELNKIIQNADNEKNINNNYGNNLNKNNENPLLYTCEFCNCSHIFCKECQDYLRFK